MASGTTFFADPTIPYADNLQSYNRYSYVWNNPLSKTDPSGFIAKDKKEKKKHKAQSDTKSKSARGKNTAQNQSTASGVTSRGMTADGKTKDYRGSAAGNGLNADHEEAVRRIERSFNTARPAEPLMGVVAANYKTEGLAVLAGFTEETRNTMQGDLDTTVADKENHERRRDIYGYPGKLEYAGELMIGNTKNEYAGVTWYDFGDGVDVDLAGKIAKYGWSIKPNKYYQRVSEYHTHPYIFGSFQRPTNKDVGGDVLGFILTKEKIYYAPAKQRGYVELGKPKDLLK